MDDIRLGYIHAEGPLGGADLIGNAPEWADMLMRFFVLQDFQTFGIAVKTEDLDRIEIMRDLLQGGFDYRVYAVKVGLGRMLGEEALTAEYTGAESWKETYRARFSPEKLKNFQPVLVSGKVDKGER